MSADIEISSYVGGWQHYDHSDELADPEHKIVMPGCAELDQSYGGRSQMFPHQRAGQLVRSAIDNT